MEQPVNYVEQIIQFKVGDVNITITLNISEANHLIPYTIYADSDAPYRIKVKGVNYE